MIKWKTVQTVLLQSLKNNLECLTQDALKEHVVFGFSN